MKKILKRLSKKIAAALLIGTTAVTLSVPAPAVSTAEAGVGDAIGVVLTGVSMAAQRNAVKKEIEKLDSTEEGRKEILAQFQKKYGVNNDYALNQRVESIMSNLQRGVAAIDPTVNDQKYIWFINNDQNINAFCALGRVMSINTGLMNNFTSDDEIAAVIGHEMGHGQKGHVKKGIMKEVDTLIALSVGVAATGGSSLSGLAADIANIHINAHATKRNEWEADNMAFEYLKNTNYNLGACAAIQQKFVEIEQAQARGSSALSKIFNPSDHPNSEARRDNYIKKLTEYSGGHVTMKDGTISINKKLFTSPASTNTMSSAERACFVLGNLAAAYHNGHSKSDAYVSGNVLYLGAQPIMTLEYGDESGQVLVERLNSSK